MPTRDGVKDGGGGSSSSSPLTAGEAAVGASMSDGSDGNCDLDGTNVCPFATLSGSTYTAIREPAARHILVRDGIVLDMVGFKGPYGSGIIETADKSLPGGGGIIRMAVNNASGSTAGAAKAATNAMPASTAGGAGGTAAGTAGGISGGAPWPTTNHWSGGAGGAGSGGAGGAAAGATATGVTRGNKHGHAALLAGQSITQAGLAGFTSGAGGSGGGGNGAQAGGGGGGGGWKMHMGAARIINNGAIQCVGGNGAAGTASNCGGGGGGGGGDVDIICGSYYGNKPDVRGGFGGDSGGGSGLAGNTGLDGQYQIHQAGVTSMPGSRIALTAGELAACIVSGVLDASGSFTAPGNMANARGAAGTASGTGDFFIFEGASPDGAISLRYSDNQLVFKVRGVAELTTTALGGNPAAPTFVGWTAGDTVTWRIWYDFNGGARSMGIRLAVNGCVGLDTTGTASGVTLAALTSAYACGTTESVWTATSDIVAGPTSADVAAEVVLLGDSILAPRIPFAAVGTMLGLSSSVVSLAQGGATIANQLSTWQASRYQGDDAVTAVVIQVGVNDINAGTSAAAISVLLQSLVDDIATENPDALIIMSTVLPARTYLGATKYLVWVDVVDNIAGTGPDPITGLDAVVTHDNLDDGNGTLVNQIDMLHTNATGRAKNAANIAATLIAEGIT